MKYLIVKPQGGIANRIRVTEAAYNYSRSIGVPLTIIWEKNGALNADYEVCFMPMESVKIINIDYYGTSVFSKVKRSFFNAAEAVGSAAFTSKTLNDHHISPVLDGDAPGKKSKAFFDELAKKSRGLFIETCYEFYPNIFNFGLDIQTDIKINAHHLLDKYPSLTGIHIRRTDHPDSVHGSPLQGFFNEINAIMKQDSSAAFYLSTDAEDVVQELKKIFADKIITGVTVRSRESKEGIVAALTDLYCLSQCRKILGSLKSTFSERAAIIGRIPLQIIST